MFFYKKYKKIIAIITAISVISVGLSACAKNDNASQPTNNNADLTEKKDTTNSTEINSKYSPSKEILEADIYSGLVQVGNTKFKRN